LKEIRLPVASVLGGEHWRQLLDHGFILSCQARRG
jgi:hypothetical protein